MRHKTQHTQKLTSTGVHYLELCTHVLWNLYGVLRQPRVNLGTKFFQKYYREIIDENLRQVTPVHFSGRLILFSPRCIIIIVLLSHFNILSENFADLGTVLLDDKKIFNARRRRYLLFKPTFVWISTAGGDLSPIQSVFREISFDSLRVSIQSADSFSFPFSDSVGSLKMREYHRKLPI